jgi:hypothetical protein
MTYEEQIERLITISKNKPLLPETFVPWAVQPRADELYLPENLTSLYGMKEYDLLTPQQKIELGKHEVVQVMYSYAWSEALFCMFMNRYILSLNTNSIEYRFLLRELIEEFRHQEMFGQAITQLKGEPILPTFIHRILGTQHVKFMPVDIVFLSCLAVEIMADRYGSCIRKDTNVYEVLQKVSELHNIEEARHILFTKKFMATRTAKAGFVKRTMYSYIILLNIYFMRTMYIKREIYDRIGLKDTGRLYKKAYRNYKKNFGEQCLDEIISFVHEINGFNWATRWAWRTFLKAKV